MEGKGTGWNNVFLPRDTSNQGNSPLSGDKKVSWLSCIEGGMSSALISLGWQRECSAQDHLDNWHWVKNIGVTKSWDKNYKELRKDV